MMPPAFIEDTMTPEEIADHYTYDELLRCVKGLPHSEKMGVSLSSIWDALELKRRANPTFPEFAEHLTHPAAAQTRLFLLRQRTTA